MKTDMKTRNATRAGKVVSATEFEQAMARYAGAEKREGEINREIEEEVNELLSRYEGELGSLARVKQKAFVAVQAYCVQHKETLFAKTRCIRTEAGKAGFRLGTPRLRPENGKAWEEVLAGLKEQLPAYVRTMEEPARDMLLADRNKEDVAPVLVALGVRVVQDELFYIHTGKAA